MRPPDLGKRRRSHDACYMLIGVRHLFRLFSLSEEAELRLLKHFKKSGIAPEDPKRCLER